MINKEKAKEKEELSESIANTNPVVEMVQVMSPVYLAKKYIWAMSNFDMDTIKKLGQTSIKKYWRRVAQVEIELDWLYD